MSEFFINLHAQVNESHIKIAISNSSMDTEENFGVLFRQNCTFVVQLTPLARTFSKKHLAIKVKAYFSGNITHKFST